MEGRGSLHFLSTGCTAARFRSGIHSTQADEEFS